MRQLQDSEMRRWCPLKTLRQLGSGIVFAITVYHFGCQILGYGPWMILDALRMFSNK